MAIPITAADRIIRDPVVKQLSRDEFRKLSKSPQVRELVEKLCLKHGLTSNEANGVIKLILAEMQNEARKAG